MSFSYSQVWDDTVRMMRSNASLLLPVAGMFLFLPPLILGYALPAPIPSEQGPSVEAMMAYYRANVWWMLLVFLFGFIGHLTILTLVLDHARPTVAEAIGRALRRLPIYLAVSFLVGIVLILSLLPASIMISMAAAQKQVGLALVGGLLLVLPAAYISARFAMTAPVVAGEPQLGLLAVLGRSLRLTRGSAWAIVGLVLMMLVAFLVIQMAATFVLGSIFLLIDRVSGEQGVGTLLQLILASALSALFNTIIFVLLAAIYRRLVDRESSRSGT